MSDLVTTRLSLHAVAELMLAGPQFEESGTIKLRVTPGGFGTVQAPEVRVAGTVLVVADRSVPLDGRTVADLADEVGLAPRPLDDVYTGGCGLTAEHLLTVDEDAAAEISEAFRRGEEAMAALAPEAERVLWPEHFDLGISLDQVNYGALARRLLPAGPLRLRRPVDTGRLHRRVLERTLRRRTTRARGRGPRRFYAEGQSLTRAK